MIDLLKPYATESDARVAAAEIARVLPVPLLTHPVRTLERDWKLLRRAIAWSGAFVVALFWMMIWESTR